MIVRIKPEAVLPLTLGALIAMIDGSCEGGGPAFTFLECNAVEGGSDPDEMYGFVTVSSEFYPDLGIHYRFRIDAYLDALYEKMNAAAGAEQGSDA